MPTNDFLPFCPTFTGTNLLTNSEYSAASDRTNGNQPGVASSKLNNKALRQSTYVTGQFAQFLADKTGADILDDNTAARLQAQIVAAIQAFPPRITSYLTGSGTHGLTYIFSIVSGSATTGATYTNNSVTFTVKETVASGLVIKMSGTGAPLVTGTLTKTGGTGDATLTFYAVRSPIYIKVRMVGGGAGGAAGSTGAGNNGVAGGNTTFGTTLLVANGGTPGTVTIQTVAPGGTASLGTGPEGVAVAGGAGNSSSAPALVGTNSPGGTGGGGAFGGDSGTDITTPANAAANSGSGGVGGQWGGAAGQYGGNGGGAGGFVDAFITSPAVSYAYAVGAGGAGGAANSSWAVAGNGGSGHIQVTEHYQ